MLEDEAEDESEELGELVGDDERLFRELQLSDKEKEPVAPSNPSTTTTKSPAFRLT